MGAIPIHYDCDPGQDDAIALLYALGSKHIDIRSISVVGGNADVWKCARNTLQILELAGRTDIPVFIGAEKPLENILTTLPQVFGESGMAGAEDLPEPKINASVAKLPEYMTGRFDSNIIVATGPLTNLALAIQHDPQFLSRREKLIIMGGCVFPEPLKGMLGNFPVTGTEGYAEYNFAVDPEAAQIVFASGIKDITLIGLNVTRSLLYNINIDRRLRDIGSQCAIRAARILSAVGAEDIEDYADLRTTPDDPVRAIHDVLAMACCDRPDLFTFEMCRVKIITGKVPAIAGQSLLSEDDFDHPAVRVAKTIDKEGFIDAMINNLSRLP